MRMEVNAANMVRASNVLVRTDGLESCVMSGKFLALLLLVNEEPFRAILARTVVVVETLATATSAPVLKDTMAATVRTKSMNV